MSRLPTIGSKGACSLTGSMLAAFFLRNQPLLNTNTHVEVRKPANAKAWTKNQSHAALLFSKANQKPNLRSRALFCGFKGIPHPHQKTSHPWRPTGPAQDPKPKAASEPLRRSCPSARDLAGADSPRVQEGFMACLFVLGGPKKWHKTPTKTCVWTKSLKEMQTLRPPDSPGLQPIEGRCGPHPVSTQIRVDGKILSFRLVANGGDASRASLLPLFSQRSVHVERGATQNMFFFCPHRTFIV